MVDIINGYTGKPMACQKLSGFFLEHEEINGHLYYGYPFIYPTGLPKTNRIDCLLISPEKGLVAFNLIEEETVPPDLVAKLVAKQEEIYNFIELKLIGFGGFYKKHKLVVNIEVIAFAPNIDNDLPVICNEQTLGMALSSITFSRPELYEKLSIAIRTIEISRRTDIVRQILKPDSKGAHCRNLEKSRTMVLDQNQIRVVTEIIDGVQYMQGLSGSGKSTVLALKAAYIHACHPEWKIGVTFNTISARNDSLKAIESFYRDQTGLETNWDNIKVCQSWGLENGKNEDEGMYGIFTAINHLAHYEYANAKRDLGMFDPFGEACDRAMLEISDQSKEVFDIILMDEAHDFPANFFRMCYAMLKKPKRLVFAYDELQNFRTQPVQSPEGYFCAGDNSLYPTVGCDRITGMALDGCYRKPPAILSAAHALAFGIYRKPPSGQDSLTQMFENMQMWNSLGYELLDGRLDYGERVVIGRRPVEPEIKQPDIDDQIVFKSFKSKEELDSWVFEEIMRNVKEDELRIQDIMIIVPDALSAFASTKEIESKLRNTRIRSHSVGINTPQNAFWSSDFFAIYNTENSFWSSESVVICNLYQARSHEAAMVYVIDADTSWYSNYDMALIRNRLYSAMTRSKAWVRVVGVGKDMDWLVEEYERVKSKDFKFEFVYPTKQEIARLRMAFRDRKEEPII